MTYIFCDTETTSLDPTRGEVWEIGYAVDEGPVRSAFIEHTLRRANPVSLKKNNYHDRFFAPDRLEATSFEVDVISALTGATLVGANPGFDAEFMKERWGYWDKAPWKYRTIDVETYAMPALHLDEPQGLKYIAEQLHLEHQPNHTAWGDVAAVREAFYALRKIYDERLS